MRNVLGVLGNIAFVVIAGLVWGLVAEWLAPGHFWFWPAVAGLYAGMLICD